MALGAATSGLLPVPEIQYLAYLHNAEDQLRGEAATLQFFSQGAYRNPMVVRLPGLVVTCPAHPRDAPALLRTCIAAAREDGTVSLVG